MASRCLKPLGNQWHSRRQAVDISWQTSPQPIVHQSVVQRVESARHSLMDMWFGSGLLGLIPMHGPSTQKPFWDWLAADYHLPNVIKLTKSALHSVRHSGPRIRVAYRASHWKQPYLNDIDYVPTKHFEYLCAVKSCRGSMAHFQHYDLRRPANCPGKHSSLSQCF